MQIHDLQPLSELKQSSSDINADLLRYYTILQEVFKEYEVRDIMPTIQEVKDAFNAKLKPEENTQVEEEQKSFWEIYDEFTEECGRKAEQLDRFNI